MQRKRFTTEAQRAQRDYFFLANRETTIGQNKLIPSGEQGGGVLGRSSYALSRDFYGLLADILYMERLLLSEACALRSGDGAVTGE